MYFEGSETASGRELWKTDGTPQGTVLIKDIAAGSAHSSPRHLVEANGKIYFAAATAGFGPALWVTDGTEAGTVLVKDIDPGGFDWPIEIVNVNGVIMFSASDGGSGREPWKSDGTAAGTIRLHDIYPGPNGSIGSSWVVGVLGGRLLFAASDGTGGHALRTTLVTRSDFDGETRADVVVYRPGTGQWWINRSCDGFTSSFAVQWGDQSAGDVPAPADFDGDGKVDPTVFRPAGADGNSFWFIRRSLTNYADGFWVHWGTTGDQPVPGYYDGIGVLGRAGARRSADIGGFRRRRPRGCCRLSTGHRRVAPPALDERVQVGARRAVGRCCPG
jgi:ELWxxDGT repeat protein